MIVPPASVPRRVLVLGGARSGKSRYAERLAAASGRPVVYIATAEPGGDAEMAARLAEHRARRPAHWTTREAPLALVEAIGAECGGKAKGGGDAEGAAGAVLLIDCLTLWLSNVMLAGRDVRRESERLVAALGEAQAPAILVSNEVGEGIVPATPLGRAFRDAQGRLNQDIAFLASDVVKLVAGCPLVVKPRPEPEIEL